MESILKIQQQTKEISKTQLTLIDALEQYQKTGNNNQLKKIIEDSKQNQEKIFRLQNKQINTEIEVEKLIKYKNEFDMVLKDLKQNHSLEVAELLQINEQIKIEFQINLKNLQNKLQAKCNEYEKKQENFQELQKKVIILSRLVADKNKEEKEIMCTHQKLIDEAQNLDYDQIKEKKQKLLKNQQVQLENLKKFQCKQKQQKEAILQQDQANLLNQLQQQQRLELQNIDKILNEKEKQMLLIEKAKREKDEKGEKEKNEEELLIKYKEQQKEQISKKEPKRQQIDKIQDFNKIDKNINILVVNLECKNRCNEISDQGAQYIITGIKELKNLTELNLNLEINNISYDQKNQIRSDIQKNFNGKINIYL